MTKMQRQAKEVIPFLIMDHDLLEDARPTHGVPFKFERTLKKRVWYFNTGYELTILA